LILVSRFDSPPIDLRPFVRDSGVVIDVLSFRSAGGSVRGAIIHSHLSGGFAVFVENGAALREFVSSEAFLNISLRPPVQRNVKWSADFDTVFPNELHIRARDSVPQTAGPPPALGSDLAKRLMKEVKYARQGDRSIQVLIAHGRLDDWRVFMEGPPGSPYAGKWWYLILTFTVDYPRSPPLIRFHSVPFHFNVSDDGRICMNLLDKDYTAQVKVFELLVSIQTLLANPNYDDPIDLSRRNLAKADPDTFKTRVLASVSVPPKDSPEEWKEYLHIE
jgi:ubiquitin-protein ligase